MAVAFIPPVNFWVRTVCALIVYVFFGADVIIETVKDLKNKEFFTEHIMMSAATLGAIAIGEFADAAAVMLFYSLGEYLCDKAYDRSKDRIDELMEKTPEYANVLRDGETVRVRPDEVKAGEHIVVMAGEHIPLDGIIEEGSATADTSAITGESVPYSLDEGDRCISGSVCLDGKLVIRVESEYSGSVVSRISNIVKEAENNKSKGESFISKLAKIFTPAAFSAALLTIIIGWLATGNPLYSVRTALVILVISCPCALILSVPLAYYSGIGEASANGIVFKGGNVIEQAASAETFVFDKTGTITTGNMTIAEFGIKSFADEVKAAAKSSNHPLCRAIAASYPTGNIAENVSEIAGKGIVCDVNGKKVVCGSLRLLSENGVDISVIPEEDKQGTSVYAALNGEYVGRVAFSDRVKDNAAKAIGRLRESGAKRIVILSGDKPDAVEKSAKESGITEYYASLLPEDKLKILEEIIAEESKHGRKVAYCGDGINDAAAIARADVGVAMGGSGAMASVERADIAIMNDSLETLFDAFSAARKTRRIAVENTVMTLGVKLIILIIGIFFTPSMELAVIADTGVALPAVINAVRRKLPKHK